MMYPSPTASSNHPKTPPSVLDDVTYIMNTAIFKDYEKSTPLKKRKKDVSGAYVCLAYKPISSN